MPRPLAPLVRGLAATLVAALVCAAAVAAPPARAPSRSAVKRSAPARPAPRVARVPRGRDLSRDTLAWVGTEAVTAEDLVRRIEFMPWQLKQAGASMDSAKVRALESLVGERLLAQEARRDGLGGSGPVARTDEGLRRALARDALYHDVVADVPAPTAAELEPFVRARLAHATPDQRVALRKAVSDSLRNLGREARAVLYMEHTLAPQKAEVDSATFVMLADSLRVQMIPDSAKRAHGPSYAMVAEDIDVLTRRLDGVLDRPLVRLPDRPLSLGDALEDMHFYRLAFHSLERRRFAVELSQVFRAVVEGELMAREALRRGLDRRPEVQRDLATWDAAWRARLMIGRVMEGARATDDEAIRRFAFVDPERAMRTCEVDLDQVLVGSRDEGGSVVARVRAGASFDSLSRTLARVEWRSSEDESRWLLASTLGRLGYAALLTPLDTLSGPMQTERGWSLYRVRGKRLVPDSLAARPALDAARDQATLAARAERVARHIAELATRERVSIDYPGLGAVDVAAPNVFAERLLGFGGGMVAEPTLIPLWDWMPIWRQSHTPRP